MAKSFAPRVAKKQRETLDLSEKFGSEVFKVSDEKLLKGARLDEIQLKEIVVRDQVRTKFNDGSIKELAANIKTNGLIQPLVLHLKDGAYTLICGERRFRAMSSIKMRKCPCFILEGKTDEELMAIQFSENSSREALHYIDRADGILNYQKATKASERRIVAALGISKSEVHRSLLIAKLPRKIKEAAKSHNIEKYVLLEFDALPKTTFKSDLEKQIVVGEITKRAHLKKVISGGGTVLAAGKKRSRKVPLLKAGVSANALLKAMNSKSKSMKMDKKTRDTLKQLLQETSEIIDA